MKMHPTFIDWSLDSLYQQLIHTALVDGAEIEARGLKFKEIIFTHSVLLNTRARVIENPYRNLSKKFMMAEFIWIMSGQNSLEMLAQYNKNIVQFSDDGKTLHGAYGPRLRNWEYSIGYSHGHLLDQLQSCLDRLQNDRGSRQAVAVILDPGIDFTEKTKDIPCNDLLQFFIRDNALHMSCYVRSNDLNWGFSYDVFHWTMLQELFARILGVEIGEYHHFCGSLHIYDKDYDKLKQCLDWNVPRNKDLQMQQMAQENSLEILYKLANAERHIREGSEIPKEYNLDEYWLELLEWLK